MAITKSQIAFSKVDKFIFFIKDILKIIDLIVRVLSINIINFIFHISAN